MKKIITSLVLSLAVLTQASASDGGKIQTRLIKSLEKQFAGALNVKWEAITKENIYHARFVYNNERLSAFFEPNGRIIGIGRYIEVKNMPLLVTQNINNQYPKYQIQDAIEYTSDGETSYVISISNESSRVVLRAYSNGSSSIFKKEKKN